MYVSYPQTYWAVSWHGITGSGLLNVGITVGLNFPLVSILSDLTIENWHTCGEDYLLSYVSLPVFLCTITI